MESKAVKKDTVKGLMNKPSSERISRNSLLGSKLGGRHKLTPWGFRPLTFSRTIWTEWGV